MYLNDISIDANKCIYNDLYACLTIDVMALEAALRLLNPGRGCGRLVRERRQLLSFCLRTTGGKKIKTLEIFFIFHFCYQITTYLQTSVHEVHLQSPSLLVWRDTSRTHYPVTGQKANETISYRMPPVRFVY